MEKIHDLLLMISKNQNSLLEIINKYTSDSFELQSGINEKLSDSVATSVSMLHMTEKNIEQVSNVITNMKGIQNLTSTVEGDIFSPIQDTIFNKIFQIIELETDFSIDIIKNDFIIHSFKNFGVMMLMENVDDRKIKEEYFFELIVSW